MYKQYLALNNLQNLICHKPNQPKPFYFSLSLVDPHTNKNDISWTPHIKKLNSSRIFNENNIQYLHWVMTFHERDVLGTNCQFLVRFFFFSDTLNSICTTSLDLYLIIIFISIENGISRKCIVAKGGSIWITFLDKNGYPEATLSQHFVVVVV